MPRHSLPPCSFSRGPHRLALTTARLLQALAVSGLCVVLAGCGAFIEEKRRPVKPHPLGETYGQMYDEAEHEKCRNRERGDGRCQRFLLRRNENPEIWPYRDVPPLKWPEAPKESVYREGMTPVEYWRALCKAEAGEFIYRTVEVEGVYQVRPRKHETDYAMADRYIVEDPYGNTLGEEEAYIAFTYLAPKDRWTRELPGYSYLESGWHPGVARPAFNGDGSLREKPSPGRRFQRYYGFDQRRFDTMRMVWVESIVSTIGFTWRGIRRPMDRELGIAGGELAVVDLKTNQLLGLRRGFILGGQLPDGGVSWGGGNVCPDYMSVEGPGKILRRNKHHDFGLWFLTKVAKPSGKAYSE